MRLVTRHTGGHCKCTALEGPNLYVCSYYKDIASREHLARRQEDTARDRTLLLLARVRSRRSSW